MPAAYSNDLRKKIIEAISKGTSVYRLSRIFSIERTIFSWKKKYLETGSLDLKVRKKSSERFIVKDLEKFKAFVEKDPDRTLEQMAKDWGNIAPRTISSTLKRAGFTYKKNFWLQTKRSN